jgi:L-cysteine desulfidase
MRLHTTSEVISLARKLESESANLYRDLSGRYIKDTDVFTSFARENERNIVQIERAYYGVITDAIEGGFAFDMESEDFTFEAVLAKDTSYPDALDKVISIEEKIIKFYLDAARQSDALMADIPGAFRLVARKREARRAKLKQLLDSP